MANSGGSGRDRGSSGGGGDRGGVPARVTIPETVRKTIQTIREITGRQHTNEDIYSVLKECSMDPNETAQKLLYLDTFHEVKSKRDRRKEMSGIQGRGARGSKGNHSANHMYHDGAGWRNAVSRRENGVNHMKDKGPSNNFPVVQKLDHDTTISETKAPVKPNGSLCLPNVSSSPECGPQSPKGGSISNIVNGPVVDSNKSGKVLPSLAVSPSPPNWTSESVVQVQQGNSSPGMNRLPTSTIAESASGVYSCASDPVPSMTPQPGTVGPMKREGNSQQRASEHNHMKSNKYVSTDVSEILKTENITSTIIHPVIQKNALPKQKAVEKDELSSNLLQSSLSTDDSSLAVSSASGDNNLSQESVNPITVVVSLEDTRAEDSSSISPEKTVPNGHVIFPNHFKIPEALKSGLSFGSFDTKTALGSSDNGNACNINVSDAVELSCVTDETVREPLLSNQSISSTVQMGRPDHPESPQQVSDKSLNSDVHVSPAVDPKSDKSVQEMTSLPEGNQNPAVHGALSHGFGIMPHMQGGHLVQFAGHETQNENPRVSSSPSPGLNPTPPQNSMAASPQPVLFRPPFPPNYYTYGHYFNPYFLPTMHQFVSHNGLPQQPSAGNPYLTPASPVPGMKFPPPQFKPGTSTGNSTPTGIQGLHGSYGCAAVGLNPGPVTSGGAASNEDLSASQLKESQIYTTGPLNDVSAWISPSGQDISSLHLNPLYHLTPQGQHLTFSHVQPGPSPFPGIYPPMQTIPAPSTINPVLQQSPSLSATAETAGPPPGAYQQTQLAQINWNTGY